MTAKFNKRSLNIQIIGKILFRMVSQSFIIINLHPLFWMKLSIIDRLDWVLINFFFSLFILIMIILYLSRLPLRSSNWHVQCFLDVLFYFFAILVLLLLLIIKIEIFMARIIWKIWLWIWLLVILGPARLFPLICNPS